MTVNEQISEVNPEQQQKNNIVAIHYEKDKFGAAMCLQGQFKVLFEDEKGINLDLMNMISLIEDKVIVLSSIKSNLTALRRKLPLVKYQEQPNSSRIETSNFSLLNTLKNENFSSIAGLYMIINRIIDSERCKTSEIYMIKDFIDPRLDDLRLKYRNLPEFLTEIVQLIAKQIRSAHLVEVVNIVYFPQLGFLITLPAMSKEHDPKARGDRLGFQLQFQSDKVCYYKNEKMRELDETIGDIYADIIDAQLEIMRKIVDEILKNELILVEASDICSELDCLISLAKVALMYSLTKPIVVEDPVIQVEDGRHMIVEMYSENECIANDCNLIDQNKMMLLTGANSSGKSVYLKQIGIIVYLTHIGSYVPARFAKIGLVDRILTRIKTNESSGKHESSFLIDLKQVREICETWTQKSLVLIDEFGEGTCEQDGMALFSGLLNYLSNESDRIPRLIAITHMQEILRNSYIRRDRFMLAHMKIYMDKERLCYLYKVAEGIEEESYAIECAREAGISEKILAKALTIKNALRQGASPEDLHILFIDEEKLQEAIQLIKGSY